MNNIETRPHILTDLDIEVHFEELAKKIRTGTKRPDILTTAKKTLLRVNTIWNPAIVYRWLPTDQSKTEPVKTVIHTDDTPVIFDLGHSTRFLSMASNVLVAAYSAGSEIEIEARNSSDSEELLDAFFLDLIDLLVLEKTGDIVKKIAEQKAADLGWGVSPFLSPGSIHGWELKDQHKLCSILPLDKIGLQIRDDAVLSPFKSLSCLIGIGAGYEAAFVGTTCQICSKNGDCQMKQF